MLTIRLWTAANDIDRVELVAADPYELTGEGQGGFGTVSSSR